MEFPLIYGHPRSGTNFVCATLKRAFLPNKDYTERKGEIKSGHWANRHRIPATPAFKLRGGHRFYGGQDRAIYVYRDGRDVAVSLWRTKELQHPDWADLEFSEFLRRELDWHGSPGKRNSKGLTISEHWYSHVRGWNRKSGVLVLGYETLLDDPRGQLDRVAEFLGAPVLDYELPEEPCAPFAGVGGYGGWCGVFSAGDLEYFYSICPINYWALYEKGETDGQKRDDGDAAQGSSSGETDSGVL